MFDVFILARRFELAYEPVFHIILSSQEAARVYINYLCL